MTMLRVNYDDLEIDEWGDGFFSFRGKPFTGIAYELYKNGQISDEVEYTEGLPRGTFREWYPSGILKSEGYIPKKEEITGWQREWFENGQLKLEKLFTVSSGYFRERRWNEQGELTYEYEHPSPDKPS